MKLPGGRTDMCGSLRLEDAGRSVILKGWVARKRDHGGVVFFDLRDREGVVQVVAHPEDAPGPYAVARDLRTESVVEVAGSVRPRPPGTENPSLPTGEVEVAADAIDVLTEADTPPFPIEDRVEADEVLRLKYRYLDLRRPEMTRILVLRHRLFSIIRQFFEMESPADRENVAVKF